MNKEQAKSHGYATLSEPAADRRSFLRATAGLAVAVPLLGASEADAAVTSPPDGQVPVFGPVTVKPGDPRYAELSVGDNQRWVGSPDYIQVVGSTQQVVDAVQSAVSNGLRVQVRSGGHCYEDFVANPEVRVVIDTSGMNAVYFDDAMQAFAIEPGAQLLDVFETLYKGWNVTVPAGLCYSVGAGGHICGGGDGPMSRLFGLAADYLHAVEVVVVDAAGKVSSVVATSDPSDPNQDLWWAHTGGGGGNFGVVTRYWMRSPGASGTDPGSLLPNPPGTMLLTGMTIPWADLSEAKFTTLVQNFGKWHEANSAPGAPGIALVSLLTLSHVSNGSVSMFALVDGTAPNPGQLLTGYVNDLLDGVVTAPQPVAWQSMPWLRATRYIATSSPALTDPDLRADHKSAYLRQGYTDAEIATIYKYLTSTSIDNPNAMLQLIPYGGNLNAVAPSARAFPHRDSVLQALYQSAWKDSTGDSANIAWVRDFYAELYAATGGAPVPNDHTDGCYVNYPDTDLSDPTYNSSGVPWHYLYYKDNYPRLQRAKATWDPQNIFRHTQSIELPA